MSRSLGLGAGSSTTERPVLFALPDPAAIASDRRRSVHERAARRLAEPLPSARTCAGRRPRRAEQPA